MAILVALLASVRDCNNHAARLPWGEDDELWLPQFLKMPDETLSEDMFLLVSVAFDPKAFESALGVSLRAMT